jgi:hypothetical protein
MTTYDLKDQHGRVFAFEIDNGLLDRRGFVRIVQSLPGVRLTREPTPWRLSIDEQFCEFDFRGVHFTVWEPFGDSDRYWIGPEPPAWAPEVVEVRDLFGRAGPQGRDHFATIMLVALFVLLCMFVVVTTVLPAHAG